jgi:DNA modification methylase
MVAVFREVRRVLRPDGTLWLNYGDCYAGASYSNLHNNTCGGGYPKRALAKSESTPVPTGLKPKDLVGMPWRVAFALQADGWWLRSDIIWHKPNPMPESVTDRPTCAHEYLFLLAKSARYFYDADAIREAHCPEVTRRTAFHDRDSYDHSKGVSYAYEGRRRGHDNNAHCNPAGRNKRSVWTVATHAFSGAHFATFPPKLITPCILAGTSERGCCSECGAPWVRVTQKESRPELRPMSTGAAKKAALGEMARTTPQGRTCGTVRVITAGWRPTCDHDAEVVPCTVLDPFGGSGTTAEVAIALGRRWIVIELNPDYEPLIRQRTAQLGLFGGDDDAR